jgi:hypothetical protein
LLRYTVSNSDNSGYDILFKLAGGTQVVNDFIHSTLPDGTPLIISVFVKDAAADDATRERVIARIAATAYK